MFYSRQGVVQKQPLLYGAVAQLIERVVRNDEVVGLIPICSTTFPSRGERKVPSLALSLSNGATEGISLLGATALPPSPGRNEPVARPASAYPVGKFPGGRNMPPTP